MLAIDHPYGNRHDKQYGHIIKEFELLPQLNVILNINKINNTLE